MNNKLVQASMELNLMHTYEGLVKLRYVYHHYT